MAAEVEAETAKDRQEVTQTEAKALEASVVLKAHKEVQDDSVRAQDTQVEAPAEAESWQFKKPEEENNEKRGG